MHWFLSGWNCFFSRKAFFVDLFFFRQEKVFHSGLFYIFPLNFMSFVNQHDWDPDPDPDQDDPDPDPDQDDWSPCHEK